MTYPVDVIWLIVSIWSVGFCVLPRGYSGKSGAYTSALAFACGYILLASVLGLIGLTTGYGNTVLYCLGLFLTVSIYLSFPRLRSFVSGGSVFVRRCRWTVIPICVLPAVYLWSTLGPETFVDSLWYHLAAPKFWLLNGRLADVPFNVPSHYPMFSHLPYVMVLWLDCPWQADVHARLFSVFPLIPLLLGVYGASARRAGRRAGIVAVALTGSVVWWPLPAIANVQAVVALFTFLGFAELWRWIETRRMERLVLSSILTGAACATKLNAVLLGLIPCLLLICIDALRNRRMRRLWLVPAYGFISALWLAPWWISNAVRRGNPFYPFAESLCPSPEPYHSAAQKLLSQHHLAPVEAGTVGAWLHGVCELIQNLLGNGDVLICLAPCMTIILVVLARRHVHLWASIPAILVMAATVSGLNAERLISVAYPVLAVSIGVAAGLLPRAFPRYRWLFWLLLLLPIATTLHTKYLYISNPEIGWHGQVAVTQHAYYKELIVQNVGIDTLLMQPSCPGEKSPLDALPGREVQGRALIYTHRAGYPYHLPGLHVVPDFAFGNLLDTWLIEGGRELALSRFSELGVNVLYIGRQLDRAGPDELERLESLLGDAPEGGTLYVIERGGVCRRCWGGGNWVIFR